MAKTSNPKVFQYFVVRQEHPMYGSRYINRFDTRWEAEKYIVENLDKVVHDTDYVWHIEEEFGTKEYIDTPHDNL